MGDNLHEFVYKPAIGLDESKVLKVQQTNEKWRYPRDIPKSNEANQIRQVFGQNNTYRLPQQLRSEDEKEQLEMIENRLKMNQNISPFTDGKPKRLLNRGWFSMKSFKGPQKTLSQFEEFQEKVISEVIKQIEAIIYLTPVLLQKFNNFDKLMHLIVNVQNTFLVSLNQYKKLAEILLMPDSTLNADQLMAEENTDENNIFFAFPIKSKFDLNLPIIQLIVEHMRQHIFNEIDSNYQQVLSIQIEDKDKYIDHFNNVRIAHSKLKTIIFIFPYAISFDKKDLFSLDKQDEQWKRLEKYVIVKQLASFEKLKESLQNIVKGVHLANAMVSHAAEQKTEFEKKMVKNFGAVYYYFQSHEAKKKAHLFFSEPRTTTAQEVWNLMDTGLIKYGMSIVFPSIKYNRKIFIDPVASRITLESVLQEYYQGNINKIEEVIPIENVKLDMLNEESYYGNLFVKDPLKIRIRILCSQTLVRPDLLNPSNPGNSFPGDELIQKMKQLLSIPNQQCFESLIIHVHGGGFVAMSSRGHQTYTRQWANILNVPIFSIDYKKAPENPYPAALDDVWQAYNWILHFVDRFFNIKPRKVVLVGDSAGGNLILALTLRCIKRRIRIPDGILAVYPGLNLNSKSFTPSLLLSLDDQILPHAFLKMCLDSYVPESHGLKPESDPFLSPSCAADELLKMLPPTRIMVGTNDPLHDDCWRFLQKLEYLQKDVKMTVYPGMPHGFLNYDAPSGMKEAKVCVEDAAGILKELLQFE